MSQTAREHFPLPIAADRYLQEVYLDPEFTASLYRDGLGFSVYETLSLDRDADGGVTSRRMRLSPPSNAPKVVQKVLGATQEYEERGRLDGDTWRFEVIPATMASRISVQGSQRAEPAGDGRCRVEVELCVAVKILGVGGAVERFMLSQFGDNIARQQTFTQRWLDR